MRLQQISRFLSELRQKKFLRHVAVVASGSAASQIVAILFSPLLTRLYGPAAYGELNLFLSAVGILSAFATLSYANAIILPREDGDAWRLLRLSVLLAALISILGGILLTLGSRSMLEGMGIAQLAPFIALIPVAAFLTALAFTLDQWLIRKRLFGKSSRIVVLQSFIDNAVKVGFGLSTPSSAVLIGVSVLSSGILAVQSFLASAGNRYQIAKDELRRTWLDRRTREIAWEYRDFPLYRTPDVLLNSFSQNAPVLVIGVLFGSAAAAFYAIGNRVIMLPFLVVSQAVSKVLAQKIADLMHEGEMIKRYLLKATGGMALVGAPFFLFVALAGPWVFGLVFGDHWTAAGEYARWLGLWAFVAFCNTPCVSVIPHLGLQAHSLVFAAFAAGGRVAVLWAGFTWFNNALDSIMLFSIFGMIINMFWMGFIIHRSGSAKWSRESLKS